MQSFSIHLVLDVTYLIKDVLIALHFCQILQSMASVKWDIREIKSQHSSYVDNLVQVVQRLYYSMFDYSNFLGVHQIPRISCGYRSVSLCDVGTLYVL